MSEYTMFHRHSDDVITTAVLGNKGLPKHRRCRRQLLHTKRNLPATTFAGGDVTTQICHLEMLHYAQILVGSPPVSFMVALDTGSVILCGCVDCAHSFETDPCQVRDLNSYIPGSSSTSANVSYCGRIAFGDKGEADHMKTPLEIIEDNGNHTTNWAPSLSLKMKGGADFHVKVPTIEMLSQMGEKVRCLGIVKNSNFSIDDIIGHNFMTGYHLVFDREESIMGWKPSNCIAKEANTRASSIAS